MVKMALAHEHYMAREAMECTQCTEVDAGCVECGRPVDRLLPTPIPEGYECMWSEAMTGRALYCKACYGT